MRSTRNYRAIELDDFPTDPVEIEQQGMEAQRLTELTKRVREIYYLVCRDITGNPDFGMKPNPRWDGGQDKYGRNHKPVWPKIAKHLAETAADPLTYIKAQFVGVSKDRLPLPNTFWSAAAIGRYSQHVVEAPLKLKRKLDYEMQSISARATLLRKGLDWPAIKAMRKALLTDSCVYASPLTRFCVACEYEMADIAALYHDAALIQYVFQKNLYDSAWDGCIPASLQEECLALHARLLM